MHSTHVQNDPIILKIAPIIKNIYALCFRCLFPKLCCHIRCRPSSNSLVYKCLHQGYISKLIECLIPADPCTLPPSARLKNFERKLGTHLSQGSYTHRIDRKIHSKMCAKSLRAEFLPFGVSNYISVPECHKNV